MNYHIKSLKETTNDDIIPTEQDGLGKSTYTLTYAIKWGDYFESDTINNIIIEFKLK